MLVERSPQTLEHPGAILFELAIGFLLGIGGGVVYPHTTDVSEAFSSVRPIGFAWPLVGIMSAGIAFGGWGGLIAGLAIAFPRWFAPVVNGVGFDGFHARGYTYKIIGERLFISPKTVENHVRNILQRLHLSRKQEMIRYAVEHGIE